MRVLLAPDAALGDDHFHDPWFLPEGRGILFTIHRKDAETDTLAILADGKRRNLLQLQGRTLWRPVYSRSGHILYSRHVDNEGIWALPFSLDTLEPTGEPFLVLAGGDFPSVAEDGTLVARLRGGNAMEQLVWVDREGKIGEAIGQPQPEMILVALAPDGKRIAVTSHEGENWDIWVHDVARATKTRLTFESAGEWGASWSPSGDQLVYELAGQIMVRAADGTGAPLALGPGSAPSFTPDGRWLVYQRPGEANQEDLWVRPADARGEPRVLLETPAGEWAPRVSPDGNYLSYVSEESGDRQVYLTRFPDGGGKWQVSVDGGAGPVWSPTGQEIVYRNSGKLMAVSVRSTGAAPVLGTPQVLFDAAANGLRPQAYDVSPDGKRLVVVKNLDPGDARRELAVITNWFAEFRSAR